MPALHGIWADAIVAALLATTDDLRDLRLCQFANIGSRLCYRFDHFARRERICSGWIHNSHSLIKLWPTALAVPRISISLSCAQKRIPRKKNNGALSICQQTNQQGLPLNLLVRPQPCFYERPPPSLVRRSAKRAQSLARSGCRCACAIAQNASRVRPFTTPPQFRSSAEFPGGNLPEIRVRQTCLKSRRNGASGTASSEEA
jgi:hypothetical protein